MGSVLGGLVGRRLQRSSGFSVPVAGRLTDALATTGSRRGFRLRARWVVPCGAAPIADGVVECEEGRIVAIKTWRPGMACIDLGDMAIMPGFVNTHSHIEYTILRGIEEDLSFFPWIRSLIAWKQHLEPEDWLVSAQAGAIEMALTGVTTVGDASDSGASVSALAVVGIRGIVFREFFGIENVPDSSVLLAQLEDKLSHMQGQIARFGIHNRLAVGVSPHAPYTVRADLFEPLGEFCQEHSLPQMIHLDESREEMDWMRTGTGPFAEMFERRGLPWEAQGSSSFQYVRNCGGFTVPTIAVHCVHLDSGDEQSLARDGVSVAHCPRSNAKLGAGIAPVSDLINAGLEVGLGTDSPLTANSMDFFEEIRAMVFQSRLREENGASIRTRKALEIATHGGARALGLERVTGSLDAGLAADMIGIRLDGIHMAPAPEDNPEAALVYSARACDVAWTMVDGKLVQENGNFPQFDLVRIRSEIARRRRRIRSCRGEGIVN
jgi:cytosine/adenosine deaminase-related metal-dependent hydrolase